MIDVKAYTDHKGRHVPAHRRRPRVQHQTMTRPLCVRMSTETFDRIRHLAEERNSMTMSEFVRTLLNLL